MNKTCDVIFPGRTGKSKGYISSPNVHQSDDKTKSSNKITGILKNHEGPLACTASFVPTDAQSITVTVGISNILRYDYDMIRTLLYV